MSETTNHQISLASQNVEDQRALRRVAKELRGFLSSKSALSSDPEVVSLLRDIEALERVAAWIGNRVVMEL